MALNPSFASYLGMTPAETVGMRVSRVNAVYQTSGTVIDLTADAQAGLLPFVQAVYLDLADIATNVVLTLTHVPSGFRLKVKGGTQGWYPISCNDLLQFQITATNLAAGVTVPMWFANFSAPNFQWASV